MSTSNQSSTPQEDILICYCFDVHRSEIVRVILEHQPKSVSELIGLCEAGNGCSSCWCDLEDLLKEYSS